MSLLIVNALKSGLKLWFTEEPNFTEKQGKEML